MSKLIFGFFLLVLGSSCNNQKISVIPVTRLASLPVELPEASGITVSGQNTFFALNDQGNRPELYLINKEGKLLRTVTISNAKNHDWEDLAKDRMGNLYIADTGNNNSKRKEISVLKISAVDIIKDTIKPEIFEFRLSDHPGKKKLKGNQTFDIEAILEDSGSLYLFTRDRSPKPKLCRIYRYNWRENNGVAEIFGSFTLSTKNKSEITGATIDYIGKEILLISNSGLYVLPHEPKDLNTKLFPVFIPFGRSTQKEAICIDASQNLFIAEEKKNRDRGALLFIAKKDWQKFLDLE